MSTKNKKGEFSFVWLFAIIVGGMILFFAIYGAIKSGGTIKRVADTTTAKEISILTDPLQAGFAEGSFGSITFTQETKIMNTCNPNERNFGKNEISVSTKTKTEDTFGIAGVPTSIYNKYIFTTKEEVGKTYYVFSKQFKFPYKVSDLVFMTAKNYCFIGAPESVREEIDGLHMPNINCSLQEKINVCFGTTGTACDIRVLGCMENCGSGTVIKSSSTMEFVGNLMYAAIFSDEETYNCNVKRLMYRTSILAELLAQKADIMSARDCSSNLGVDLASFAISTRQANTGNLRSLQSMADNLEKRNKGEICGLWE